MVVGTAGGRDLELSWLEEEVSYLGSREMKRRTVWAGGRSVFEGRRSWTARDGEDSTSYTCQRNGGRLKERLDYLTSVQLFDHTELSSTPNLAVFPIRRRSFRRHFVMVGSQGRVNARHRI